MKETDQQAQVRQPSAGGKPVTQEPGAQARDLEHALQVLCAFIRCGKDGDLPPPVLMAEADRAVQGLQRIAATLPPSERPSE